MFDVVSLSNNDVIQIDATVIVGLLILITFQFALDDFSINPRDLELNIAVNHQLYERYIEEIDALSVGNSTAPGVTRVDVDPQLIKKIQSNLQDLHFEQYVLYSKLGYLHGTESAKSEAYDAPGGLVDIGEFIRFMGLGMLGPFALSAFIECILSFKRDKENDRASRLGIGFMMLGFFLIVLGMLAIVAQFGFNSIL